jgi:hypothetical protein
VAFSRRSFRGKTKIENRKLKMGREEESRRPATAGRQKERVGAGEAPSGNH